MSEIQYDFKGLYTNILIAVSLWSILYMACTSQVQSEYTRLQVIITSMCKMSAHICQVEQRHDFSCLQQEDGWSY